MRHLIAAVALFHSVAYAASTGIAGMEPVSGNPNLLASGIPAIPAEIKARVGQYLNARSAALLDQSDDGQQVLISTRFASTAQMHLVQRPMGARVQLTFLEEPINSARFLPGDPQKIFYSQDVGGGEFYQLYQLDRRSGRSELITDGKSRHDSLVLSRNGKRLAYSGTGRNGRDTDVYLAETSNPRQARRLTERQGAWHPVGFSPDGERLLIVQFRAATDADLHWMDLKTGQMTQLTPKQGAASVGTARFSADGKSVYLVTDRYSDFDELYLIDLASPNAPPRALSRSIPWDVEHLAVADDGSRVAFSVNQDGVSRVYLLEGKGAKPVPVDLPKGIIGNLQFPRRRSSVLSVALQTARSPSDVWQLDVRSRKLTRWTRSEVGGLNEANFVEPALVRYSSKDGVTVPALIYRPSKSDGAKRPVVIIWHGGPEGQSRPSFSSFVQLAASELGIAVVLPNVRGSAGYGKKYLSMDDGVKREASLSDIGATLDWIGSQPDLDASRVGVYGGSYGGYMVLASAAFFPKRIRAAVDVVGVSSFPTMLASTSAYRQDLRRAEYGDERVPEVRAVLERISPLYKADAIEAALFVLQGKNDPRVPMSEAEQIVKAVRGRGKDVWYLLAENEGHGFRKKENVDYATTATFFFLKEKLVSSAAAGISPGSSSQSMAEAPGK